MATKIESAVTWAEQIAKDPAHGYDQAYRWGPDYDCSSFVISAWEQAGVPVKSKGANYTGNMVSVFKRCGFEDVTSSVNLRTSDGMVRGDVLVNTSHHVAMYYGGKKIVHASKSETGGAIARKQGDQTGKEICIRSYYNYPWNVVLRYTAGGEAPDTPLENVSAEWHAKATGGYDKESDEAQENAICIYKILYDRGWTLEAVSALLGNFHVESGYNPWRWQSDSIGTPSSSSGYGLAQFTPAGKYINSSYAQSYEGYDPNYSGHTGNPNDGNAQILFIDEHADYYSTSSYPLLYDEFKISTESVDYLTAAWIYNYERPADPSASLSLRQEAANYWYTYLSGIDPGDETKDKGFPIWMMIKYRW